MKKLTLALALASACAATSTFAATGTITFAGELVTGTCAPSISGGGATGGAADDTVTLPTMNISSLAAANATAGTTAFTITLTDTAGGGAACQATSGGTTTYATPYFEPEVAKVNAQGRLINTGAAGNVDIQLLANGTTPINVNDLAATQVTSTRTAVTDGSSFNYAARYFATAATTAGDVAASVSHSIIYK